jgi:hypothetical protein
MESKKIISMGLLIIIIIISLVFSMIITPLSKEGLEIVRNPTDDDLNTMKNILDDSTIVNFTKIQKIYDIAKNYPLLNAMYINLSRDGIATIAKYIKNAPIKDRNGDNIDKNAVDKKCIEYIKGILYKKSESSEKFFAIKPYIRKDFEEIDTKTNNNYAFDICDKKLFTIYKNYEEIWIDMLNGYVNQLNSDSAKKNKSTSPIFGNIDLNPQSVLQK